MLACFGFFITLVIVYHLSNWLILPLTNLIKKINLYNRGAYTVHFESRSCDEISALSSACNEMILVFNEHFSAIDTTLKAFTKARSYKELGQLFVEEIKKFVLFKNSMLIESDGTNIRFPLEPKLQPTTAISKLVKQSLHQDRISELLPIDSGISLLIGRAGTYNVFLWLYDHPAQPSKKEQFLLQLLSRCSAIFYENLHLIEEMSNRIVDLKIKNNDSAIMSKLLLSISEKERKRLAIDLHDDVLQEIIQIKRTVSSFLDKPDYEEHEIIEFLKIAEKELLAIIQQIRQTCYELMPTFLMEKGIGSALSNLIEKMHLKSSIEFTIESLTDSKSLDYEESLTVYRVVQELIANAIKHSQATKVDLMLQEDNGMFIISYTDNGIGIEQTTEQNDTHHFGLMSIRERIKILNGETSFHSLCDSGLKVTCQFPLKTIASL